MSKRQNPSFSKESFEILALCLSEAMKAQNLDVVDGNSLSGGKCYRNTVLPLGSNDLAGVGYGCRRQK
ncbi:MAG TPA: hypothetical protein VHC97_03930 [Thermoanaerobaculia bacterium]|jgi:hypothetical protein|nr:hypothetical protein [Thermoanaerobaculia bacterium]